MNSGYLTFYMVMFSLFSCCVLLVIIFYWSVLWYVSTCGSKHLFWASDLPKLNTYLSWCCWSRSVCWCVDSSLLYFSTSLIFHSVTFVMMASVMIIFRSLCVIFQQCALKLTSFYLVFLTKCLHFPVCKMHIWCIEI